MFWTAHPYRVAAGTRLTTAMPSHTTAPPAPQRNRQRERHEREKMNRIPTLLKRRAAVRREQSHTERVREERERNRAERAARATPCYDERWNERERQKPVGGREPANPCREERPRAPDPRERRRLVDAAEPADEPAFDLGRGRGGIQRAHGPQAEQRGGRHGHDRHERERRSPAERYRTSEDEEGDEKEGLRPRQDGQRRARRRCQQTIVPRREESGGHQERGERDLHA